MNFLDKLFLKFLLPRIFGHWKSSTAGIATTIALVTLFQHSYKAGMSWEQWLVAALPGAIGAIMQDVKNAKVVGVVLLLFAFGVPGARAQTPAPTPSQLPGWQVSVNAGYSLLQGATSNNGIFSDVEVSLPQPASWKRFSLAMRGDYFTVTSPAVYVIDAGPQVESVPFAIPSFMSGQKFQVFLSAGLGAARSQATAANLTPQYHLALKLGGGINMPVSSTVTWRLLEVDYIRSRIFPGGSIVMSNMAQLETGIGIHF